MNPKIEFLGKLIHLPTRDYLEQDWLGTKIYDALKKPITYDGLSNTKN